VFRTHEARQIRKRLLSHPAVKTLVRTLERNILRAMCYIPEANDLLRHYACMLICCWHTLHLHLPSLARTTFLLKLQNALIG
jgi:hypothetical protein